MHSRCISRNSLSISFKLVAIQFEYTEACADDDFDEVTDDGVTDDGVTDDEVTDDEVTDDDDAVTDDGVEVALLISQEDAVVVTDEVDEDGDEDKDEDEDEEDVGVDDVDDDDVDDVVSTSACIISCSRELLKACE
jgi:hypothetical protein